MPSLFGVYNAILVQSELVPNIRTEEQKGLILGHDKLSNEVKKDLLEHLEKTQSGLFFFDSIREYLDHRVFNLHLSKCYHCGKIAVWVHDRLLFPVTKFGVLPNPDLPEEILHDFEEAREIVNSFPRGAAALLRLCVQKLCIHLGEKGKSIDEDIVSLVKKGLNPLVKRSLDIVRVIGNEAVHQECSTSGTIRRPPYIFSSSLTLSLTK